MKRQMLSEKYLHKILNESIHSVLNERRIMVFGNNHTYPNYGQAVFMLGGCGSGKSYLLQQGVLPLNAKKIDLDEIKEKYIKLQQNPKTSVAKRDSYPYNLSQGNDIGRLHLKIRHEHWEERILDNLLNPLVHNRDRLPNLIFDKTAGNIYPIMDYASRCQQVGYETTLVWVVTSRSRAIWNNLNRSRSINQDMFHIIHNDANENLLSFIPDEASEYFDNIWIIFNSSEDLKQMSKEESENIAVKLEKTNDKFVFPQDLYTKINQVLGPYEYDVNHPRVYQDFNDIRQDNFQNYGYKYQGDKSYVKDIF